MVSDKMHGQVGPKVHLTRQPAEVDLEMVVIGLGDGA